MKVKESWQDMAEAQVPKFLNDGHEGRGHPSRSKAIELLAGMRSVLDVGCGIGVMFDLLNERRPDLEYLGIDATEKFVREAARRYPEHAQRFKQLSLYDLPSLQQDFDAVLCRHILEHLPDYRPAVQNMYERALRKLIIVFYLPPRPLLLRHKRDEKFERGFYTHTYDLGRFMDHVLNELKPLPAEVRVHPRQGKSDPATAWSDRENIIFEVLRGV
jgi:SAM-dependent methyltransferase